MSNPVAFEFLASCAKQADCWVELTAGTKITSGRRELMRITIRSRTTNRVLGSTEITLTLQQAADTLLSKLGWQPTRNR